MESSLFDLPKVFLMGPDSSDESGVQFKVPSLQVCGGGAPFKERPEIRYCLTDLTIHSTAAFSLLTDRETFSRLGLKIEHRYRLDICILGRGESLADEPNGECEFFVWHLLENSKEELKVAWTNVMQSA